MPVTSGPLIHAADAALRFVVKRYEGTQLFARCATPLDGLTAAVYTTVHEGKPAFGVVVEQAFDNCGGGAFRPLDWREDITVSREGSILARNGQPVEPDDQKR